MLLGSLRPPLFRHIYTYYLLSIQPLLTLHPISHVRNLVSISLHYSSYLYNHTATNQIYLHAAATAATKSFQSCLTLCDPIDGSPPGSPVPGTLQARTVQWVAISFSNAWKWKVKVRSLSPADSSLPHGLQPTRLFHPWDFLGKSTGVGCHRFLRYLHTQTYNHLDLPSFVL